MSQASHPTLYLLMGYPGSGKTTAAVILSRLTGARHLWADKTRHDMFGAVYRPAESHTLYRTLNAQAAELLGAGESVVFDTNFNYRADRDHLRRIAASRGAVTRLLWLVTPKDIAYQRAIVQTDGKRLFVTMTHADFERVVSHLEPPDDSEQPIVLDGTKITPAYLRQQLGI